ncbi:MAG TPA: PAS domain-containing sensor histidine kinase [Actinomycetota bacterium]
MEVVAPSRTRRVLVILVLAAVSVALYAALPADTRAQARGSESLFAATALVAAFLVLRAALGWPSRRSIAFLLMLVGVGALTFLLSDVLGGTGYRPAWSDLAFLILLVPLVLALRDELRAHLAPRDRRETAIDVALISFSLAAIAYTLLRPADADAVVSSSTAVFALLAAATFTVFAAVALWVPSVGHLLLFLSFAPASLASLWFGWQWTHEMFEGTLVVDLVWIVAPLGIAAVLTLVPHPTARGETNPARVARPVMTSVAVMAACAALVVVSILDSEQGLPGTQSTAILALLVVGIAVRILANQFATAQARSEARDALEHRERALREADRALGREREANETLRSSEEHLRLVFDAAADGFVELDERNVIVRANEAFAWMVGLDRSMVEGRSWDALTGIVQGGGPSFQQLPETGQGEIRRAEGQPLYLESRISNVPTLPPRRLMLVRDVTAAKVADRTIRSLFQFLQDRDEDRTRLLRRTNAAIEQERNRIARDLHDGPVQGVSAASLSLEAALLMIKAGDVDRGLEVLTRLRGELAGEADALRRLMAGLRPPVLEERGLMPALRETLARFGTDLGVATEFTGHLDAEIPGDLETLAFRVVQEALTNIAKHADASRVTVHVSSEQEHLRIEVEDDGTGFETERARDFLRSGRVGLASMRERVELASGTFAVRSTPGRGTAVMATIPLDSVAVTVTVP